MSNRDRRAALRPEAAAIRDAEARIARHVRRTPVLEAEGLWDRPVALKLEQMQHTGSFKVRGAFETLLTARVPEAGVVAASGGNHGVAVAFAARALGHRATVFVPEIAGPAKIALIREAGAALEVVPGVYADALDRALAHEAETGAMPVHAYDGEGTVRGQGTTFAEWDDQGLDADTVLVAVGGGGLIAGALGWWGGPGDGRPRVVAVEPERAPTLHAALAAGRPVDVEVSGVAANALGAQRVGAIAFERARSIESVLVSDDAILAARDLLWRRLRQLTEPAGAAALAALVSGAYRPEPGERVAVLVCGANPAPDPLPAPLAAAAAEG